MDGSEITGEGVNFSPPPSVVGIAISGDKNSKYIVRWALDKFVPEGNVFFKLIHVRPKITGVPTPMGSRIPISQVREDVVAAYRKEMEWQASEKLVPYKKMCASRKMQVDVVLVESDDVANAIAEEVAKSAISNLVLGAPSRGIFKRKQNGLSSKISACTPRFCTVYAVSKGKLSSVRASDAESVESVKYENSDTCSVSSSSSNTSSSQTGTDRGSVSSNSHFRSPSLPMQRFQALTNINQTLLSTKKNSNDTIHSRCQSQDLGSFVTDCQSWTSDQASTSDVVTDYSPESQTSQATFNLELEKLRIELRHAKGMYAMAQSETMDASRKIYNLNKLRLEEAVRLKEINSMEEKAIVSATQEKEKYESAKKEADYMRECVKREVAHRREAEMQAMHDAKEKEKLEQALVGPVQQYQKFSWDEIVTSTSSFSEDLKIGMGAYGTVYKGNFHHTTAAVKVLHSIENRQTKQFQQELEILSKIRHPHLLLLLGACPDHSCLVYEYMENGSLEDRLLQKNSTPPIPWFERFRIAWEVASTLVFLHSTKPKPIIHRDLKPANILLDHNLVSKIGDVGLATMLNSDPSMSSIYSDTGPVGTLKLKKLSNLWIRQSNLIGELPETLGEMEALEVIDLAINSLSGRIPNGLFTLKNLSIVYLFKNTLSGEVPQVIESWNLSILDISENTLSGTIPEEYGNLTKLTELALFLNDFSGEIPKSIGRLPNLRDFKIFNNNFSGTLPPELGKYSKLEAFQVSVNRLTGKLPDDLCYWGKLDDVIAYGNYLSGELPSSLGNCSSLKTVKVQDNMLSGNIPSGMWTAPNLTTVLVSNNSLTGKLPEKMSSDLSRLEMRDNKFSGNIPTGVSSWTGLKVFDAGNNHLSGAVPRELTALSSLMTLSLDQNQLTGSLPSDIVSWESLASLNFSRNQLSGTIPEKLGLLPGLTGLDLSANQLSGEIPDQLGRLKLNQFNLSSNHLTGEIPTEFENSAYEGSFLDNQGLCAPSSAAIKLPICNSESRKSSKLSSKSLALILSLGILLCLLAFSITVIVVRSYWKRNGDSNWKLNSFQRLNFSVSKILSGLTERNLIGSGGSGKVYRVPVNRVGGVVAVKKIWKNKNLEEKLEKEFLAEVKILSSIRHANIVKLMCCISSKTSKLLVYEYLDNRSLDRWLHRRNRPSNLSGSVQHVALDWPKRLQIAVGAAQGLSYMHHDCVPPVVHRDVKSSNILLDSEFNAKIADFGLAKMLVKQGELATMSSVAGSFGYMAPEYAHTTRVNEKIDVYSFGVILLELTTRREANAGDEHTALAEWAWRHFQEENAIADALDQDVKEPCYLDEMCSVFKLGLICTERLPASRPSMKVVLQILLRCSRPVINGEKTEYVAAPLLKNSKRERILEDGNGFGTVLS